MKCMPTFSGLPSENAEMFLRRFETYAALKDYTPVKKALAFELSLKDKAAGWHYCLTDKDDFSSVSMKFIQKFGSGAPEGEINWNAESKLYDSCQEMNETASDYFVRVSTLARSMNKSDVEQVKIVVRGLSPNIRSFVLSKEARSMSDVEKFIKLYDSISSPNIGLETSQSRSTKHVANDKSDIQLLTEKVELLHTEVRTLKEQSSTHPINKIDSPHKNPRSRNYRHTQGQKLVCFRCSKEGHRAAECRSKYHKNGTFLGDGTNFYSHQNRGSHLNDQGHH